MNSVTQTTGPQLGRVVNTRAVSELPLATRNFTQILALSPGTSVALPDNTNLGRNSQNVSVNGAHQSNVDFSIIKRFPFSKSKNIEFRAEFFNLFNHVNSPIR